MAFGHVHALGQGHRFGPATKPVAFLIALQPHSQPFTASVRPRPRLKLLVSVAALCDLAVVDVELLESPRAVAQQGQLHERQEGGDLDCGAANRVGHAIAEALLRCESRQSEPRGGGGRTLKDGGARLEAQLPKRLAANSTGRRREC
eukprot:6209008-Pleurochrysis_carterae.AAC.5